MRNRRKPTPYIEVERAERCFYLRYLQEGMTVFDVGANVGELALLFARFVGSTGTVHAFEASTMVFERLESVCAAARRKNIVLNHTAVTDSERSVELFLYDEDHSSWNTLADRPLMARGIDVKPIGKERVRSITLDEYCKKHEIEHIDLLKIDVEGAEYQVLLGARRMLQEKRVSCCAFEFGQTHFDMGNDPKELGRYLEDLGYGIKNIVPGEGVMLKQATVENATFSIYVASPQSLDSYLRD